MIGYASDDAGRLSPRRLVLGIEADGEAPAYPFDVVVDAGVVNDRVGDLPVVVTVTSGDTLVGYDRRVGGETRSFEPDGAAHMRGGGSRWERASGRAVDGPHAGTQLRSATAVPA